MVFPSTVISPRIHWPGHSREHEKGGDGVMACLGLRTLEMIPRSLVYSRQTQRSRTAHRALRLEGARVRDVDVGGGRREDLIGYGARG